MLFSSLSRACLGKPLCFYRKTLQQNAHAFSRSLASRSHHRIPASLASVGSTRGAFRAGRRCMWTWRRASWRSSGIPLLLPLTLATLLTSHWTYQLGVQALGIPEGRSEHARLHVSTWYVLLGVVSQQALSVFVFAGARLTGWQAVVGAGALICGGCCVLTVAPASLLQSIRRRVECGCSATPRSENTWCAWIAGLGVGGRARGRRRGGGSVVEMRASDGSEASNREPLLGNGGRQSQ